MLAPKRSASCRTGSSEASVGSVVRAFQTRPSPRLGPSRKATVAGKPSFALFCSPSPSSYCLLAYSASRSLRRSSKSPVDPHNGRWRAVKDP